MTNNFSRANVIIKNKEDGVQPAIFIIDNKGVVHMITITPDHKFTMSDEGIVGEKYNEFGEYCGDKDNSKFVWTDKEDHYLAKYGITILYVTGRSKAIQKFVEELSYKIGSKCDFGTFCGRSHIDVSPDYVDKALEAINEKCFMDKFIVPYSEESYNNETYFDICR